MDSDNVAVLHTEVVAHNTVDTGASIIKVVIGQDDQHSVLALLALDQDCVTTEELKGLHGVVREGDHRVIIVNGIGHTGGEWSARLQYNHRLPAAYINELGFFFFLRIAVEVSSSCDEHQL